MAVSGLIGARGAAGDLRSQGGLGRGASSPETLFFVHIPKCAGSSFRQVLKRWFGAEALFLDTHDEAELKAAADRLGRPPRAIAGHIPFGLHGELPVRPCYVSLVRHPLDRFVSFYGTRGAPRPTRCIRRPRAWIWRPFTTSA
ncbi:MAG TPA: sulfotransferase family 2 domain-containing protein [Caulobacteraceae bacterium]